MKIYQFLLGLLLMSSSLWASNARPFPHKEPPTPRDSMVLFLENTQQELAAINADYLQKLTNLQSAINENTTFLAHKELAGQWIFRFDLNNRHLIFLYSYDIFQILLEFIFSLSLFYYLCSCIQKNSR